MKIRIVSYIIAIIMLVSVLLSAVSCDVSMLEDLLQEPTLDMSDEETTAKDTDDVDTDDMTETDEVTTSKDNDHIEDMTTLPEDTTSNYPIFPDPIEPETPVEPQYPYYGLDFGGEQFMIVSTKQGMQKYYAPGTDVAYNILSSLTADRDNIIGENYNVQIVNKFVDSPGDVTDLLRSSTLTGTDDVDAVVTSTMYNDLIKGYLASLDLLDIDFTQNHWDLDVMENVMYGDQYYAAFGDMLGTNTNVILYNKDMANNYCIEGLYDLVYEGMWTLEALHDAMKRIGYTDYNGNGIRDNGDAFPLSGSFVSTSGAFVFSSDMFLVDKDNDGNYMVYPDNAHLNDVYSEVKKILIDSGLSYNTQNDTMSIFNNGYSLFELTVTSAISNYANVDFNFGILPYPKASADQVDYCSLYTGQYICVPTNLSDYSFTGITLDILNYYSQGLEDNLWLRVFSSEDDINMMGIIRNRLVSEFALTYNDGTLSSLNNLFANAILNESQNIMVSYKQGYNAWNTYIRNFNK